MVSEHRAVVYHLGVVEHFGDVEHRRARNVSGLECLERLVRRELAEQFGEHFLVLIRVPYPGLARGEARIVDQMRDNLERIIDRALDRGIGGAIAGPSAYFMKSPPIQYTDDVARNMVEAFILGEDGNPMVTSKSVQAPVGEAKEEANE